MYARKVSRFELTKKIKHYRRFTDKADAVPLVEEHGLIVARFRATVPVNYTEVLGVNANSL